MKKETETLLLEVPQIKKVGYTITQIKITTTYKLDKDENESTTDSDK
jgi:hypothetical protein